MSEIADWTTDPETGHANASVLFRDLVDEVARMLRDGGGRALSPEWARGEARVIMGRLAHVYHLIPAGCAGNAGVVIMDAETSPERFWLDWAKASRWRFRSYYKHGFTFACQGVLAITGRESGPFTATVGVGGDASDIYRFNVTESMTWDEIAGGGECTVTVRSGDGVIFSTGPRLMPEKAGESA